MAAKRFSWPPGLGHLLVGLFLLSPLIYRQDPLEDAMGYLVVAVGSALTGIGMLAILKALRVPPTTSYLPKGASAKQPLPLENTIFAALSALFFTVGHLIIAASVLGLIYMGVIAKEGGSGVPIAFAILAAPIAYVLGGVCKAFSTR
jgi:hypothetical protein